jgi:TPR repeat protein
MNLRNKALAACCSIALGAGPACAEGYEQGRAAYKNGQHREAYELFRAGAENDHAASQYMLCLFYQDGIVVERDEGHAYKWCRKSAEQNNVDAQLRLGLMLLSGVGVESNEIEAIEWLNNASDGGNQEASEVLWPGFVGLAYSLLNSTAGLKGF